MSKEETGERMEVNAEGRVAEERASKEDRVNKDRLLERSCE